MARVCPKTVIPEPCHVAMLSLMSIYDCQLRKGPDRRTPYAMRRDDGAEAYLVYDQIGSLRMVVDSIGNVINGAVCYPFGGVVGDANPNFRIPSGFAGGNSNWCGCLDDPVNGWTVRGGGGLLSIDGNAVGFGMKPDVGTGAGQHDIFREEPSRA